ncbi:MAG: SOUL heme-binding protein [uncultured Sulfurovum sp.]|uniref:SOUL heme-binding protein n=1 Tax=uncultured Sulfurovum sp. TaxID=269237 RepID=A0A6S6TT96_9BACT|nr:MAG: SOUL heme-binding protein [uncultured Sulfurovum sp.]
MLKTSLNTAFKTFVLLFILQGTLMGIEEPKYTVIQKNETFEVREYASYLVAQTKVTGNFDEIGGKAFKILFKYISGENQAQSKIKMTAPVLQEKEKKEEGQKIQMTAPVMQEIDVNNAQSATISFVMPQDFTLATLPMPLDKRISIKEVLAKTIAVREYSGGWGEDNYKENEAILLKALEKEKIKTIGAISFARYNSPFSLWFLRRNEIMIEVEKR